MKTRLALELPMTGSRTEGTITKISKGNNGRMLIVYEYKDAMGNTHTTYTLEFDRQEIANLRLGSKISVLYRSDRPEESLWEKEIEQLSPATAA